MDDRYTTKTICGEEWLVAAPSLFFHKDCLSICVDFDGRCWRIYNCGMADGQNFPNRNAAMVAVAYGYGRMAVQL
jgi:hypothetical protein